MDRLPMGFEVNRGFVAVSSLVLLSLFTTGCLHTLGETGTGSDGASPEFTEVSSEIGLEYEYTSPKEFEPSAGVYVTDYDNDGWEDVLTTGGDRPVLFKNSQGEFLTTRQLDGLNESDKYKAASFFDYNNDGWEDLLLLARRGEAVFFENDGGEFGRKTVGLEKRFEVPMSASVADYTGNGCLDVFVSEFSNLRKNKPIGYNQFNVEEDNGNRNRMFAGDCEEFEETTEEAGIRDETWSLATSFVDLTNDGHPDIHVANDFNNDVLYINNGNGTFDRRVLPNSTNRNGMSSEVADVNDDGLPDIFVTNIYYPEGERRKIPDHRYGDRLDGNNLFLNKGNGTFVDVSSEYGVKKITGWGWAAVFEDFDNDGYLDLAHSTTSSTGSEFASYWRGSERGFVNETGNTGMEETRGIGMAALDYNLDGRMDIAESNQRGHYRLYENVGSSDGNWLQVDVENDGENTEIGARVEVETPDGAETQILDSGSDYLSQDTRVLHFGLGATEEVSLRVEWPDGTERSYEGVSANQRVTAAP